ncbi:MAG: methionine--tRNA ligase [Chthoniobacterales bacterium]
MRTSLRSGSLSVRMPENFYIATAIDYTNSAPHIGHAYEKILADVIARYRRLKGDNVFFLTGVDQHGQKVQQSAEKQGLAPAEFVADVTKKFTALWQKLDVRYDGWAATTEARHKQCVQKILQHLFEQGQLYKAKQGGYYSVRQEQFLTDKERAPDGEFGPEWGEVEFREEENYYFKLARHKEWLLALIDARADLIHPEFRRAELRNAVEKLGGDLCISRPKSRLSWGIEMPFDPEFVTYVWFDALVNYISFAPGDYSSDSPDLSEFRRWWPALIVIGKDILIPAHGIYWMIMLHALGFSENDMPSLLVHGWWNIGGAKMSKSLGNVADPDALADKYGAEAVRYYLMSDIVTGRDADFSEERLVLRYNNDLANSLGNLLNRTLNMAQRYCGGSLEISDAAHPTLQTLKGEVQAVVNTYDNWTTNFAVDAALTGAIFLAGRCNQIIERDAPWKLAKDSSRKSDLSALLYGLAEALRVIAILISPVTPKAARGIFSQLNWDKEFRFADVTWGGLPHGHVVGAPVPLFPRIETGKR